jgi:PAS domain S-box-containing protein
MTKKHNNNSLPKHDQLPFKVIETDEQRMSLYDPVRQEILRVLTRGIEDYSSETRREQKVLDDGTRITEEVRVEKPIRRYWMTVPEILETLREKNPDFKLATTKAYYHLGKLHEQDFIEQYPEDKDAREKRVRGRYFRTSARFFVEVTVEASVGYSGSDVMPDEIGPQFLELAENVRETGATTSLDYQANLDGILLWLSMTMSLHRDKMNIIAVVRDITSNRSLEERLAKTESDLGRLIEESFQGYAVFQNDLLVLFNPAYSRTVGRSKQELENLTIDEMWTLIHPDDRKALQKRNLQIEQGVEELPRIRFRYLRPDGSVRWVESFGRMTEHKGKRALLTLEIDITDRIKAEIELQENEQRNRIVASAMSDLVVVYDANDRYEEYFGDASLLIQSWEKLRGEKRKKFIPHEIEQEYEDRVKTVRETGESVVFEYPSTIQGVKKWLHETILLHEDNERIVTAAKDITIAKNALENLKQSYELAQMYLDLAGVMIIALDSDGDIAMINQRGLEVLGYEKSELVGSNWFMKVLHEEDRKEIESSFRKLMNGDIDLVERNINRVLTKDGDIRSIEWQSRIITDNQGEIIGTLSSGEDITEHIQNDVSKEHDSDLKECLKKYAFLLNSVSDPIIFVEDIKIVEATTSVVELFGYERNGLLGKTIWGISPRGQPGKQLSKAKFLEKLNLALDGSTQPFLWRFRNVDGQDFDAVVTIGIFENEKDVSKQFVISIGNTE